MTPEEAGSALVTVLLEKLFDPPELRRFLERLPDGRRLSNELRDGVSRAQAASEATRILFSYGGINLGFFGQLDHARPNFQDATAFIQWVILERSSCAQDPPSLLRQTDLWILESLLQPRMALDSHKGKAQCALDGSGGVGGEDTSHAPPLSVITEFRILAELFLHDDATERSTGERAGQVAVTIASGLMLVLGLVLMGRGPDREAGETLSLPWAMAGVGLLGTVLSLLHVYALRVSLMVLGLVLVATDLMQNRRPGAHSLPLGVRGGRNVP